MQTMKQRRALIEIAQPIGGVPDYAEPTTTKTDQDQPMARRNSQGGQLILFVASALAMTVLGLALFAKLGG